MNSFEGIKEDSFTLSFLTLMARIDITDIRIAGRMAANSLRESIFSIGMSTFSSLELSRKYAFSA